MVYVKGVLALKISQEGKTTATTRLLWLTHGNTEIRSRSGEAQINFLAFFLLIISDLEPINDYIAKHIV